MINNNFTKRHIGPNATETDHMLKAIGVQSIDELIDKTLPAAIRLKQPLNLPEGLSEAAYLNHIKALANKNKIFKTYIGLGYYNTVTPPVIIRNILENPGWYTSYTPYQAEISQGRLEALLNYQTMIADLTALPLANSSLLDDATAAAEAMLMFWNARSKDDIKNNVCKFFISEDVFAQVVDVMKTRAVPQGIELVVGHYKNMALDATFFGALVQYPSANGSVESYGDFVKNAHTQGIRVAVYADLMSLALLTPPGEWDADCVVGSTQRFGLPMGFGGPSAGYFACKDEFKRQIPGRIIGKTIDAQGKPALRMALQTREQHIKREKATSNICTASALMAVMSGMYAVYHGAEGIREIAKNINIKAGALAEQVKQYGYNQLNTYFFDTLLVQLPEQVTVEEIRKIALANEVNFRYIDSRHIGISIDETTSCEDINMIIRILAEAAKKEFKPLHCNQTCGEANTLPANLKRTSTYLTHPVFNTHHSETAMMRYVKKLEIKDLSLNRAMIPLGSCTMKLNAAAEMLPLSFPEFGAIHPFVPKDQAAGYYEMIDGLCKDLATITGFETVSVQPNSGAAGEYAGLMVIRAYHLSKGDTHRTVCLIPDSAHGTNPASAAMAGMDIVVIKSNDCGEIDVDDMREKVMLHKDKLSCVMITYPSTRGVFEESILDVIKLIHENGGLVYMDGANMNAQVGLTNPGTMGADVCHLNLHKTFAMPHGGGGPGVGPIGVAKHLVPFLPGHSQVDIYGSQHPSAVAASPFGSPFLLPITYGYIKMLGVGGLTDATKWAILNANYIKARLRDHYKVSFCDQGKGMVAHELILDCNAFSMSANIQVIDIAKRLMDYGFHAPTVAFPVHGTLMVEPTESEPLSEMDRLCDAMIAIRQEIKDIEEGKADKNNNVIKNAPHTMDVVCADTWNKPYTRQQAAFALPHDDKYWPTVSKVDDAYGDRNLICVCND